MSQTKHKMPDYVKQAVIWLCKGYADNAEWYAKQHEQLYSRNYRISDMPKGGGCVSVMEEKVVNLESHSRTRILRAIDNARLMIGADLQNEEIRKRLCAAIWESTRNAREYPYEMWNLPTICRDDFYERKREFIKNIALGLELM